VGGGVRRSSDGVRVSVNLRPGGGEAESKGGVRGFFPFQHCCSPIFRQKLYSGRGGFEIREAKYSEYLMRIQRRA
jgi:hypothetical protein